MCDIDHFKSFNDRYGHAIGDEVIKAVAGIYNTEAAEVGLACRYGGEEFCVMLPGCDETQALAFAEILRKRVQDTAGDGIDYEPRLSITSSFGVAVTRAPRLSLDHLIDQADQALYQSKRAGRNRCTLFEEPQTAAAPMAVADTTA
jgi:diguanylate cyclase (GGDEF)-like protein